MEDEPTARARVAAEVTARTPLGQGKPPYFAKLDAVRYFEQLVEEGNVRSSQGARPCGWMACFNPAHAACRGKCRRCQQPDRMAFDQQLSDLARKVFEVCHDEAKKLFVM